jgi:hypothetical protein
MTVCAECDAGFHSQCASPNGCDCDCNYESFFSEDLTDIAWQELDVDDFDANEEQENVR